MDEQPQHTVDLQQHAPAAAPGEYAAPAQQYAPQQYGQEQFSAQPAGVLPNTGQYSTAPPPQASAGVLQFAWAKTIPGALRLAEWLMAIIMFATMADISGYKTYSEFEWQVACGVLCWLYVFTLIVLYVFRSNFDRYLGNLPFIELVMDAIFCVLLLAAAAATSARCNKDLGHGLSGTICNNSFISSKMKNNFNASIVFSFFLLISFMVSTFYSYRAWKNPAGAQHGHAHAAPAAQPQAVPPQ